MQERGGGLFFSDCNCNDENEKLIKYAGVKGKKPSGTLLFNGFPIMATLFVEFSREGYKIRKVFG